MLFLMPGNEAFREGFIAKLNYDGHNPYDYSSADEDTVIASYNWDSGWSFGSDLLAAVKGEVFTPQPYVVYI